MCKINKDLEDFGPRLRNTDGHNGSCRKCVTAKVLARRNKNIEGYNARNRELALVPTSRYSRFKKRCLYSGKDFRLTFEQWSDLVLDMKCHYCSGVLEYKGCALDRKDNKIGYLLDNVVPCCKECNRLKGPSLSYEEMMAVSVLLGKLRSR